MFFKSLLFLHLELLILHLCCLMQQDCRVYSVDALSIKMSLYSSIIGLLNID